MKEIRIHARAGQGAITTAVFLGYAYFLEGKYAYAFPHFGAARMGAPMNAFIRTDTNPIRLRSQIYQPDYVLIVDATLMWGFNCFTGLKDDGVVILNKSAEVEIPKLKSRQKIYVLQANEIAQQTIGRPLGNTVLIGAFAAATGELKLETLFEVAKQKFSGKIQEGNIAAIQRGFDYIKSKR